MDRLLIHNDQFCVHQIFFTAARLVLLEILRAISFRRRISSGYQRIASQEPREAAAEAAANAEQPSAALKDTEKKTSTVVITSSPAQAQLQQDGSKDSSGTRVFRLLFRGKTVFEHRCSSQSAESSSSSSSSSNNQRSPSGDYNCLHRPPPPHLGPVVPDWVMALASRCLEEEREAGEGPVVDLAAAQPRFLMTKKITKTDLNSDENRLLVPAAFVNSNIVPFLSDDEKKAASLDEYPNKKRKRREEETQSAPAPPLAMAEVEEVQPSKSKKKRKTMEVGRHHGGLQVTAWTPNRWHFDAMRLTCWDRNNATVLKGEHLKYLYDRSFVKGGDQVELWGFRDARGRLHLALHKSSPSSC